MIKLKNNQLNVLIVLKFPTSEQLSCQVQSILLKTVLTYEGTHDIHLLITGADITGIPAFK